LKPLQITYRAAVFTVLPVEYQAARRHLSNIEEETHDGNVYQKGGFAATQQGQWEILLVQLVGAGNVGAAVEVQRAISYFHPDVIIFIGVAGGLKDVQLGDVVAATKVYGYESGKADTTFLPRPTMGSISYAMQQRVQAEAQKSDWLQRLRQLGDQLPNSMPQVLVGAIAAGEKVIASLRSPEARLLQRTYGDALAVEMEGYGFLKAAHAHPQIHTLIVRGISDLIDNKREADAANYQTVAARHASAFAFEVLAKFDIENISPSSEARKKLEDSPDRGEAYLTRGQSALERKSYRLAEDHLRKALSLLHQDTEPEEHAQAQYLLALSYLQGIRPSDVAVQVWVQAAECMRVALATHRCPSYLYAFALFKRDCTRNGLRKQQYLHQAQEMLDQARRMPLSELDEINMRLLRKVQPDLMRDAEVL
jgi:nucleoside phosphorylase